MDGYKSSFRSDGLQPAVNTVLAFYAWNSKAVLNPAWQLIQVLLKQVSARERGKLNDILNWHRCLETQYTKRPLPVGWVAHNNYLSNLGHASKSAQTVHGYGLTHQI